MQKVQIHSNHLTPFDFDVISRTNQAKCVSKHSSSFFFHFFSYDLLQKKNIDIEYK